MPHTNRKKKSSSGSHIAAQPRIVHTKRQQVEDNDGWTHVIDTPRRTSRVEGKAPVLHGGDFAINGVSYVNRTVDEIQADFAHFTAQWESHDACEALKTMLTDVVGKVVVNNVVCLGLGSLQSSRREGRRASHSQLAALRTMLKALVGERSVQCVLQDPQFTDNDKEFLTSLGYAVVEDPAAFDHITENTLVNAIHCYAQVYKSVSDGPKPALLVGTDVHNFGKFNLSDTQDAVAQSLEEMVKDCQELDFPQVRHDFSDTKIYWRKVLDSQT